MIKKDEILNYHLITLKGFAFKSAWYSESGVLKYSPILNQRGR